MNRRRAGWSTESRVATGLVAVSLLLLPVVAMAVHGYRAVHDEVVTLAEVEATQLRAANEIGRLLSQIRIARSRYFAGGDPDELRIAEDALVVAIDVARASLDESDRERPAFARIGRLLSEYRRRLAETARERGAEPDGPSRAVEGVRALERIGDEASVELHGISDRSWAALGAEGRALADRTQRWLRNLILASLLTVVLLAVLVVRLPGVLAGPLRRLRAVVRQVEQEGVGCEIDPRWFPDDETRKVAEALARVLARNRETQDLQRERIRYLERRQHVLLRRSRRPVMIVDRHGTIVAAGGDLEALLGLTAAALEGVKAAEVFAPGGLPAMLERLLTRDADETEARVSRAGAPEGAPTLSARAFAVRDEERRIRDFVVVLEAGATVDVPVQS